MATFPLGKGRETYLPRRVQSVTRPSENILFAGPLGVFEAEPLVNQQHPFVQRIVAGSIPLLLAALYRSGLIDEGHRMAEYCYALSTTTADWTGLSRTPRSDKLNQTYPTQH